MCRRQLQEGTSTLDVTYTDPKEGMNCSKVLQDKVESDVSNSDMSFYPGFTLSEAQPEVNICDV
jgi:hypothetical protein